MDVLLKVLQTAPALVTAAEALFSKGKLGKRKRKWVEDQLTDAIDVDAINKKLDIPGLSEEQEEAVIRLVIDVVVEQAVKQL